MENGNELIGVSLHGESLQALKDENDFSSLHRRELKRLTRVALDRHLEGRPLHSRRMFSLLFPQGDGQSVVDRDQEFE